MNCHQVKTELPTTPFCLSRVTHRRKPEYHSKCEIRSTASGVGSHPALKEPKRTACSSGTCEWARLLPAAFVLGSSDRGASGRQTAGQPVLSPGRRVDAYPPPALTAQARGLWALVPTEEARAAGGRKEVPRRITWPPGHGEGRAGAVCHHQEPVNFGRGRNGSRVSSLALGPEAFSSPWSKCAACALHGGWTGLQAGTRLGTAIPWLSQHEGIRKRP